MLRPAPVLQRMDTPLPGTGSLGALTVFVTDLAAEAEFCQRVLGLPVHIGDEGSVLFELRCTALNLLQADRAGELVAPAPTAPVTGTAQLLLSLWVEDVDAVCAQLAERGATLLNGPVDRPWGKRTAAFASPAGLAWEVAQDL